MIGWLVRLFFRRQIREECEFMELACREIVAAQERARQECNRLALRDWSETWLEIYERTEREKIA